MLSRLGAWRATPLRLAIVVAFALATLPLTIDSASAAVTTIAIDGDQDGTTTDWQGLAGSSAVSVIQDGISPNDATGIRAQEDTQPWTAQTSQASGKSDIGYVRVSSYRNPADHLIGDIGFDRGNGTGTGRYYFELNQVKHSSINPVRTVGDLRIVIAVNGARPESCVGVQSWTGTKWGTNTACAGIIDFAVNTTVIKDYYGSPFDDANGNLPTNQFMELSVDLTALGATSCPVTGFQTFEMRTQEGNENGENGQLKDTAQGPIHIPSDCGSVVITKTVDGQGGSVAQGSSFLVSPNPATGSGSVVATTGSDGTVTLADAKPGSYTVTEIAPPGGALLPAGASASKTVTVPKGDAGTVAFDDGYGDVAFTKTYEGKAPSGTGATFTLTRTKKWVYDITPSGPGNSLDDPTQTSISGGRSIDVVDNGGNDTDADMGDVAVAGLEGGTWCVVEKSSPTGWAPAPGQGQECFTVGPTDSSSDAHAAKTTDGSPISFDNVLRKVGLRVVKTESSPGVPESTNPLGGVTFELYTDANGQPGAKLDSQVTDGAGHATFSGLDWQQTYWLQEVALDGYHVGLSPNPKKITFSATDGGGKVDVDVDNPRTEWSIKLHKTDAVTGDDLTGGAFSLWRESNGTAGLQTGGPTPDTHLSPDKALDAGALTFDKSDYDIPWGYTYYVREDTPPTGYGTMTPNPIVVSETLDKPSGDAFVTLHATDPQQPSALSVIKHDAQTDEVVDGAVFELWKDSNDVPGLQTAAGGGHAPDTLVSTCAPTSGGHPCTVDGLGFGSYWWRETTAPTGYDLPADPTSGPIEVKAGNAGGSFPTAVIKDPQKPSRLAVVKHDADTGAVVDGATFQLWRESNGTADLQVGGANPDTLVDECTTSGGQACGIGGVLFGSYYWYEKSAPVGFDLPADRSSDVIVVKAANAGGTFPTTVVADPQTRTTLQVLKHDADTGAPVGGATFQLWRETDGTAGLDRTADSLVGSCTTSGSAPCAVNGLVFGTYYWFETSAPQGYQLPSDDAFRTSAPVVVDTSNAGSKTLQPSVISDPQKRTALSVVKHDADDAGVVVPGATFELWQESNGLAGLQRNATVVGGSTVAADTATGSCTTAGSDPCDLGGLLFGTYYWYELTAPPGYGYPADPDRTSAPVVVDASNAGTQLATTVIGDPQVRSTLEVLKVDADDPQVVVAGATFQLWRESNGSTGLQTSAGPDTLVGTCTTVASDPCSPSSSLTFGTYYWLETAAPTGYTLPTLADRLARAGAHPVTLSAVNAGTDVEVTRVPDPEVRSTLAVVKHDADTGAVVDGATFQLWRESNSTAGLQTGSGSDTLVKTCDPTSGGQPCSVGGLLFGTFYWHESAAPTGYGLPADPTSAPIEVSPAKAGGDFATTVIEDPQLRSTLKVVKHDADTGAVVDGAVFELWQDTDGKAGLDRSADTKVSTCAATSGGDPCAVSGLRFGTYYWYELTAPTGYGYPASRTSDAIVVDADHNGSGFTTTVFADPQVRSTLKVVKHDANTGAVVNGAVFELWQESNGTAGLQRNGQADSLVDTCPATISGDPCSVNGLLFGTYYWYELTAPTGYGYPASRTSDPVLVDAAHAGTTFAVTVFADPQIRSTLKVVKHDADTGAVVDGATFQLWQESNGTAGLQTGSGSDTLVTTCDPTSGGKPCSVGDLLLGTYYWRESAAPTGYALPADPTSAPIHVTPADAGSDFATTVIGDPQVRSTLKVGKHDADTGAVVDGATFQLWQESNGTAGLQTGDSGDTLVDTCGPTAGGSPCAVDGLLFGSYYWYELSAPTGYDLPADRLSAVIVVDPTSAGSVFPTTVIGDPQKRSSLSVVKHDADTGAVVDGATFQLWQESDDTSGLQTGSGGDTLVKTCDPTTGGNPCTAGGLLFGTYYWYEQSAPTGYDLPADRASGAIVVDPAHAGGDFATTVIGDPQKRSSLQVLKKDAETGDVLAGAVFQAYTDTNADGHLDDGDLAYGAPVTTGQDGTAGWSGLLFGHYLVVETTAPAGYDLPTSTTQAVVIGPDNAGGALSVTFQDGPQGVLSIVKSHFEKQGGSWVPSDGVIEFGDTVRYVVTVTTTGPKIHHDVRLQDYVPGYDPADTTSTGKGTYVDGSATCVDAGPCDVGYDASQHLITWKVGDLRAASRSVAFEASYPKPAKPVVVNGVISQVFANTAAVTWTDTTKGPQELGSNQVQDKATAKVAGEEATRPKPRPRPAIQGVENTLPNTGGPQLTSLWSGAGLVLVGCGLLMWSRRRLVR